MTEPTIVCSNGNTEIKLTESLAGPPLASTRLQFEKQLAQKEVLTRADAAKVFGVTQPRALDLVRGKIDLFSIDTLVQMLASAGMRLEMKLKKAT
jgi:predicted XRE-type DNA-binding protein